MMIVFDGSDSRSLPSPACETAEPERGVIPCALQHAVMQCRHGTQGPNARSKQPLGPVSAQQHFMLQRVRDDDRGFCRGPARGRGESRTPNPSRVANGGKS
jgi:hypothetical protein